MDSILHVTNMVKEVKHMRHGRACLIGHQRSTTVDRTAQEGGTHGSAEAPHTKLPASCVWKGV